MANLVVRNVDEEIVKALKARAGRHGTSAEAEHRRILAEALLKPKKRSFTQVLASMPNVGDDTDFERETALPLLVGTARLWRSLGHHDVEGRFRIDGVTGPDEYTAVADNNVYTNLMAQQNLLAAAEAVGRDPDAAEPLGVSPEEAASWRDAAAAMVIPYDHRLGVHPSERPATVD